MFWQMSQESISARQEDEQLKSLTIPGHSPSLLANLPVRRRLRVRHTDLL
jgi:anthranilate phosphoribosyltransferase